jgi:hypothetical protein
MAAKHITHLLHAWPPGARQDDHASVVVHVRGGRRLQHEIDELKASGLSKVLVVPVGAGNDAEWWA